MRKTMNILSIFVLVTALLSINAFPVFADSSFPSKSFKNSKSIKVEFDKLFPVEEPEIIYISGSSNTLYKEFSSQEDALEMIKSKVPLLKHIQEIYSLEDLSDNNWFDYQSGMYSLTEDSNKSLKINESSYDFRLP
jgi:hypothetical protein